MHASRTERTARMVERLCQAGIAVLFTAAAWAGTPDAPGREARIVVFPPTLDRADQVRLVAAAAGLPLAAGRLPNVIVAVPGDATFADGVRARGAWFVLDAGGIAGCLGW
jgi:hypothetical protein